MNKKMIGVLLVTILLGVAGLVSAQSVESLMATGNDMLGKGAYSQAISSFRRVLSMDPGNFEAQYNLGLAYLQSGRYENAVNEFQKALRISPRHVSTWANLGVAYEHWGKPERALDALSKAVQSDPSNIDARLNLATLYVNSNRIDAAMEHYREVIRMDGFNAEAYLNLGKCMVNKGQTKDALQYLQKAVELNPNSAEAHWELGNQYWKREHKIDDGIKEYRLSLDIDPNAATHYENLGMALEEKGAKDDAIEVWKKFLVYSNDALEKEKIQARIDKLEGRERADDKKGDVSGNDEVVAELKAELRPEQEKKEVKRIQTAPMDISGDLKDLVAPTDTFDLKNEVKKRKLRNNSAIR